jgi:hypothetical protein
MGSARVCGGGYAFIAVARRRSITTEACSARSDALTCHTASQTTGLSLIAALNQQQLNPFSDLAVHPIGVPPADHVTKGQRRAGTKLCKALAFFLHDVGTSDLL